MNQVLTHEKTDYELLPLKQLYESFDMIDLERNITL